MGNSHGSQNSSKRHDETNLKENVPLRLQSGNPSPSGSSSKASSHAIEVEELPLPDEQDQAVEREGDISLDWPGAATGTAPLYPPLTKATTTTSKSPISIHEQRYVKLEDAVRNASNTISSVAGAFVSVLMIAKLIEEVMFMRKLRRELSGAINPPFSDSSLPPNHQGIGPRGSRHPGSAHDSHAAPVGDLVGLMGAAVGSLLPNPKGSQGLGNVTWDKVAGLQEVKLLLQEVMVLPSLRPDLFKGIRKPPRGVLLFGPPGTGKTLLARAVATESRSTFIPITGSSILSMWFGQSEQNIKQLFDKARRQAPSVVFIDEVDSLLGRRGGAGGGGAGGGGESGPDRRVTNEFLSFIDGIQSASDEDSGSSSSTFGEDDCRVTIMAASNNPWDLDEAALSRFSRRVYIPLPDKSTRAMLIKGALKGLECDMTEVDYMRLADKVAHYSGRDLVAVCREAAMQPIRELWGNRLLGGEEGRGEEERAKVARQRLVKVIAEQIARGTPKRRIRRELEAFRRRQFQKYQDDEAKRSKEKAQSQPSSQQPGAGGVTGQNDLLDSRRAAQAPSQPTPPEGSIRSSGTCTPTSSSHPPSPALASISWLNVDEVMDQAGKLAVENQQKKSSNPGPKSPLKPSPSAPSSPPLGPSNEGGMMSRPSSFESERDNGHATASEANDHAACTPRSQAAILHAATEATFSFKASTSSAQPPASLPPVKKDPGSSAKKINDARREDGGGGGMDVLLSMPANELRPVTFADFERALAIIMPADFEGLTQKYEEWNSQYGSGADSKRGGGAGRGRHYSTMYV